LGVNHKLSSHDVFNAGDIQGNYTKKMIAGILYRYVPSARNRVCEKPENSCHYHAPLPKSRETPVFYQ